jgi:hypothetical protein
VEVDVSKCHLGRYSTAPPSEGYNVAGAELEERRVSVRWPGGSSGPATGKAVWQVSLLCTVRRKIPLVMTARKVSLPSTCCVCVFECVHVSAGSPL